MHGSGAAVDGLLEGLNEPQRQAVLHTDGPLLVLAGPGSGKTRVITRRAARLARTVTSPRHILAITFTNKAAGEMRERIAALDVSAGMTVCTFHALGAKLLREYYDRAGVSRDFTIFDRDDRRKLLKAAIEKADLNESNWTPAKVEPVISNAKNAMQTAAEFAAVCNDWSTRTIAKVYTAYEQLLATNGGLDFDDLLMLPARLLKSDAQLREALENRFRYVLVDEYQDTNAAQYLIARMLTGGHQNLCATGDPDQSIYGWRGADIGNILSFEKDYPGASLVRLEQNYRSTQRILSVADSLISCNEQRKAKRLWTENEAGSAVCVVECESSEDESRLVVHGIQEHLRQGESPNEIAVFYRVNSLSRSIEEALLRSGVVYQVARGVEFYSRKEIKDVLAYLRVLVNPSDEVSLMRILNTPPRGIGDTTIQRLVHMARASGKRLFDTIVPGEDANMEPGSTMASATEMDERLGRSAGRVRQFGMLLQTLTAAMGQSAPEALSYVVSASGLRAFYGQQKDADDDPLNNIDELINAAAEFVQDRPEATVRDWLEHTALLGDVDAVKDEMGAVTLMTLHAAKGLEFNVVYLIGVEDGLLPFRRHDELSGDLEEERRLCFVGMTRARRHLTLSRARYRMQRGVTERTTRSQFLDELPEKEIEWRGSEPVARGRGSSAPIGQLPKDIEEWTIGTLVRHPKHGLGRVVAFRRGGQRTQVDVRFVDGTERKWFLEFSELTRVAYDEVE